MSPALPTHILVPVTFDEVSRNALRVAWALAKASQARLRVLHVWDAPYAQREIGPYTQRETSTADGPTDSDNVIELARQQCADEMRSFLSGTGLPEGEVALQWSIHSGSAPREILNCCQGEGCDWIVMGTHRHRGLSHWLLGSVAEQVLEHSACPVLVVPAPRAHA